MKLYRGLLTKLISASGSVAIALVCLFVSSAACPIRIAFGRSRSGSRRRRSFSLRLNTDKLDEDCDTTSDEEQYFMGMIAANDPSHELVATSDWGIHTPNVI